METMKKVKVDPDDIIVITTEKKLTREQMDDIQKEMESSFPNNRVVLFAEGLTFKIYKPQKERTSENES